MIYIVGKSRLGMRIAEELRAHNLPFALVSRSTGAEYTREWFKRNLKDAEAVVFSAGRVSSSPSELRREHIVPLEELAASVSCRIILASSISVYGKKARLIDDDSSTNPDTPYAKAKLEQEEVLEGKPAAMLRLGVLYGEEYPAYTKMLSMIEKGLAFVVGNGSNNIPFTYVGSAASFFRLAIKKRISGPINVAGRGCTQLMAVETAARLMGKKPTYIRLPVSLAMLLSKLFGRPFSSPEEVLSISSDRVVLSRRAEAYGFKDVPIEEGIKRLVEHHLRRRGHGRNRG